MKKWLFVRLSIPILVIVLILLASFLLPTLYPEFNTKTLDYLKDTSGKIIAAAPYNPSEMPPLGSDQIGRNLIYLLIAGAKYTILSAFVIAGLRMIFGFGFAVVITFLPAGLIKGMKGLLETFQFIPLVIILYALLFPIESAFQAGTLPSFHYLSIQIFVIALILTPSLGIYLGEEMKQFMQNEFIESSRILGGRTFHLIKRHLWPQFSRYSTVLFSEQLAQTLSLLIQLGILHMCLGGLKTFNFDVLVYFSYTNEWAAMISMNIHQVFNRSWLVLAPLAFFALTIYCVNDISLILRRILIESELKLSRKKDKNLPHPVPVRGRTIGKFVLIKEREEIKERRLL
jgi:ABC-type dipeptide/oligopeptide/nickel transport system permease subunit